MITDIVSYLTFDGTCEEAFRLYEKVLGGKIMMMMRYSDAPPDAGVPPDPAAANRVMHTRLQAGGRVLMGSDAPMHAVAKPQGFSVSVSVDAAEEAERIFHALAEGGSVRMPIGETFWAVRFGMLTDRFGTPWMVNCEKPMS